MRETLYITFVSRLTQHILRINKEISVRHKQLAFLFLCNCLPPFVGMGLFPILPFYAKQFGATPTVVGVIYAAIYLASVAGMMLTSWLAGRVSRKLLFVGAGLLGIPVLALLGQATALWQVVALTAAIWFCGAVTLTLISVFTGLLTDADSRGRSFSLMFLAFPLGAIFGGTAVGQLVARYGYGSMFAVLSAVSGDLAADGPPGHPRPGQRASARPSAGGRVGATAAPLVWQADACDAAGGGGDQHQPAGHLAVHAGASVRPQRCRQHGDGERADHDPDRAADRRAC